MHCLLYRAVLHKESLVFKPCESRKRTLLCNRTRSTSKDFTTQSLDHQRSLFNSVTTIMPSENYEKAVKSESRPFDSNPWIYSMQNNDAN